MPRRVRASSGGAGAVVGGGGSWCGYAGSNAPAAASDTQASTSVCECGLCCAVGRSGRGVNALLASNAAGACICRRCESERVAANIAAFERQTTAQTIAAIP